MCPLPNFFLLLYLLSTWCITYSLSHRRRLFNKQREEWCFNLGVLFIDSFMMFSWMSYSPKLDHLEWISIFIWTISVSFHKWKTPQIRQRTGNYLPDEIPSLLKAWTRGSQSPLCSLNTFKNGNKCSKKKSESAGWVRQWLYLSHFSAAWFWMCDSQRSHRKALSLTLVM